MVGGSPLSESLERVKPSTEESGATTVQNKFESAVCTAQVYSPVKTIKTFYHAPGRSTQ